MSISFDVLTQSLDRLDTIPDEEWLESLDDRKRRELEFHDRDRDRQLIKTLDSDTYERFYGNKKYYQATELSKAYVDAWIGQHAPGKVFLDYACGNGANAIKAAQAGSRLAIGIDISAISIRNARQDAEAAGVGDRCRFVQADAENTKLPDASMDVVICSGMLHHLDLNCAFPELARVLAPGGRILAVEALDYNPLIKLYRSLTPEMRTEWEKAHILSLKDVRLAKTFFSLGEVRYWHILSIVGGKFPVLLPMLNAIDRVITRIPGIQLLAWIFTFELKNKDKSG